MRQAKSLVDENPIQAKLNQQLEINHYTAQGNERSKANGMDNESEDIGS
ncbi:MAG: hypothetical protein sL5_10030 [Candidatus Mesenet longicola]|uniref:Uncharacterized protein n=1 Tax=Candidatus Mesenet longicola TaxID=1892558 RepID=A0A8J3HW51_9RICK|nr:MAG: hypothetical protein sGL2_10440 [Candidatus Mesenet longicola]GHM60010.1 MAG: hypothetical protein sL5_10030 [Candidatus Mesenet longicola]